MAQNINQASNQGGVAKDVLISYIERVERLNEEKKALSDDINEVFAEAKNNGFDTKAMKRIIALRKLEKEDIEMLDLYRKIVGLPGQPDLFGGADVSVEFAGEVAGNA